MVITIDLTRKPNETEEYKRRKQKEYREKNREKTDYSKYKDKKISALPIQVIPKQPIDFS